MDTRFRRASRILRITALAALLAGIASCSAITGVNGSGAAIPQGSQAGAGAGGAGVGGGVPVAAYRPAQVVFHQVALPDGDVVTVAAFTGDVRFVLHCGPDDPGCPGVLHLKAGPAISPAERPYLIAAFNGGFKAFSHGGGVVQEGYVLRPLVAGRASLVIYRSGAASIGVWGQDFPPRRSQVYSVRQNLGLLVSGGQPTAEAATPRKWGSTINGAVSVPRSAIGQTASGELMYAASMVATPMDLAEALAQSGAQIGMQLDINPQWIQLAYAQRAGSRLLAGVPGQHRPADQYLVGWTRDFFTVLATSLPVPPPAGTRIVP